MAAVGQAYRRNRMDADAGVHKTDDKLSRSVSNRKKQQCFCAGPGEDRRTPPSSSRTLDHGSTGYLRGRHLHSLALPHTTRVGRGMSLRRYRASIVARAIFHQRVDYLQQAKRIALPAAEGRKTHMFFSFFPMAVRGCYSTLRSRCPRLDSVNKKCWLYPSTSVRGSWFGYHSFIIHRQNRCYKNGSAVSPHCHTLDIRVERRCCGGAR